MAEQELREAFNDCVNRMAAGQSIGECLRLYPQHAASLRPMLEVGSLVDRAQADSRDVANAQARVRAKVRARALAPRQPSYGRLIVLAASLLIAFVAVFAAAENSLPGDSLYGVKRFGENARGVLIGENFGARRVEEIRVLLALKRKAEVEFSGTVEAMAATLWQVAGLDVTVGAGTERPEAVRVGDTVRVSAQTTAQGELVALAITRDEPQQPTPSLLLTEALSPTAQPSETATPSSTSTSTPTPTATNTPAPTDTQTTTATAAPPTATATPSATAIPSATACVPAMPNGWVRYVILVGDTVGGLAAVTGASVAQLIEVNCLPESQMIIAGQALFLPQLPPATLLPTLSPTVDAALSARATDDSQHSGSGSDSGDDHGGTSGESG